MITLKGVKPLGCSQWKRKNFYLYGAIEVKTGENYFYEFSHLDGQCFQRFVNQLSQEFNDSINFLHLDNGSFHKNVDFPENIIPIFQPPHSLYEKISTNSMSQSLALPWQLTGESLSCISLEWIERLHRVAFLANEAKILN